MSRLARFKALADACDAETASEVRRDYAGHDDAAITIASALAAAYPALRPLVRSRFDALNAIAREGWKTSRRRAEYVRRFLAAAAKDSDDRATRRALRKVSAAERLRIAFRELDPDIDIASTAREWSELAEAQLEIATLEARAYVEGRFGAIEMADGGRNGFAVIGLGKLGGEELNAGSDIDLMFVHEVDEARVGAETTPFDAFTRIARRLVATIEEHDDDGFCARVDLRLRPEGGSGPITNSIASAASYYESFGRGWERAAMLRARAVAGDLDVGARLIDELVPFVWRRVVDPGVAAEMHEMVRRARVELSEAPARDLKLGPGGIREAEFFVQTLQLVWGGKDASVRSTSTLEGLRRLRARGYVSDREARVIEEGHALLRRVEHRVQLASGVQTHLLPIEGQERERIAKSLGFRSGSELWSALERARARIAEKFTALMPGGMKQVEERVDAILGALDAEKVDPISDLVAGFRSLARRPDAPLGGRARERHPRFARSLVRSILDAADPELAVRLVGTFFDRLAAPSVETYVRALSQDERALGRFVGVCGASAYLGRSLVGHPELADLVVFSTRASEPTRGARVVAEEIAHLGHADRLDPESFVGALRRAKGAVELEVGLSDLAGELDTREASRALSAVAEATLDAVTTWSLEEVSRRRSLKHALEGLSIVALGKLGGREIGYGSDLDVVFVYDPRALDRVSIDRDEAHELYARVAARIVRLISTSHEAGPGYDLDTRLRPSGEQGHLVVSLEAFAAYHLGNEPGPHAADWERQALLRLRACAGDASVGAAAEAIAIEAAYGRAPIAGAEVARLRERIEKELSEERAEQGRYDVKLGRGGLADVEFAVQLLQMRHGANESVRTPETLAAIDALEAAGAVKPALASTLRDGYRFLRRLEQRARVVHGGKGALLEEGAPGVNALARSMGFRDGEQLLATYREVTSEVHATFLLIAEDAPP